MHLPTPRPTGPCAKHNGKYGTGSSVLILTSVPPVKEQAYKSTVRPSHEYACSVWYPYTKENIPQLEYVQRIAAWYVTNSYHNTSSVSNMIGQLNWRSLVDRRTYAHLLMLFKISHELIAIPNTDRLIYHQLDFPGTCTRSHTKYHLHAYISDTNLSSSNNTKLEQSHSEHCEE